MNDLEMASPDDSLEAFLLAAEQRQDWIAVAVAERAIWGVVSAVTLLRLDSHALHFRRDVLPGVYLNVTMLSQSMARTAIAEAIARAADPDIEISYPMDLELEVDVSDFDVACVHDRPDTEMRARTRALSTADAAALCDLLEQRTMP